METIQTIPIRVRIAIVHITGETPTLEGGEYGASEEISVWCVMMGPMVHRCRINIIVQTNIINTRMLK